MQGGCQVYKCSCLKNPILLFWFFNVFHNFGISGERGILYVGRDLKTFETKQKMFRPRL